MHCNIGCLPFYPRTLLINPEGFACYDIIYKSHNFFFDKGDFVTIMDMDADTAGKVLSELPRLARAVQLATGCDGVNILQNNNMAAGRYTDDRYIIFVIIIKIVLLKGKL